MRRVAAMLGLGVGVVSCGSAIAPADYGPPFLVIVPRVAAFPGVVLPDTIEYRVRMLSTPATFDTVIRGSALDTTVIGRLPSATYEVETLGWPRRCRPRTSPVQRAYTLEGNTASIVRFTFDCFPSLVVVGGNDGQTIRDTLLLRLIAPNGQETQRRVLITDTVRFDGLAPGRYLVGYALLPTRCTPVTPGGSYTVPVEVTDQGGASAFLRLACAQADVAPRIESVGATYRDGVIGFTVRATDPDRNLDRLGFSITDCDGRGLLPQPEILRRGFLQANNRSADTSLAMVAIPTDVSETEVLNRCVAVRVIDQVGNSSSIIERRIVRSDPARAPVIATFSAYFRTLFEIRFQTSVTDPDGDLAGSVVLLELLDGALGGARDNKPDIVGVNAFGYPGTEIPFIVVTGSIPRFEQYLAITGVYLDRAGNITLSRDVDLLR